MKLSKKLLKALVDQVNMEFASGYLYRSMSHDMKNLALNGYAKWLDKQYEEEREHALKLIAYIEDRDGTVDFLPIEGVKKHYDNPLDVAKDSLAHEEAVSASIRSLVKLAREKAIWKPKSSSSGTSPNRLKKKSTPATTSRDSKKHRKAPLSSTCSIITWATDNTLLKIK